MMKPQARMILDHMLRTGSISARDAMDDYAITSATLASRICELENHGVRIERGRKKHKATGRLYTRYAVLPVDPAFKKANTTGPSADEDGEHAQGAEEAQMGEHA
jgi:hypothetical protein